MKQNVLPVAAMALLPAAAAFHFCPPTGALLPPLDGPKTDQFHWGPLQEALQRLTDSESAPFNTSDTSFSVTVSTKYDTVFQFHHTAEDIDKQGVQEVDGNTRYRIASVSKVFTVLTVMLQEGLDLDAYVWEFLPQLKEQYPETTLRLLASHLSGLVRDGVAFDYKHNVPEGALLGLGLPPAEYPEDLPICDSVGLPTCTYDDFFQVITRSNPVWTSGDTTTYTNLAFSTLAFAAENFTGRPWHDLVSESVLKPFGLCSTGYVPPNPSKVIIPKDGAKWATLPFASWDGAAGLFSTPNDLGRTLRGILNHKVLSVVETNHWLKPAAYTSSSTGGATGMPWAIVRPTNIKRASGARPLDIYTMLGSFPTYGAYIALIPEYEIGIAVNVAGSGDDPALRALLDVSVQDFVSQVDDLVRKQAEKYVGSYTDKNNGSIVLELDNGPGLKIKDWQSGGKPFLNAWTAIMNYPEVDARLYPVGTGNRWQVGFQGIPDKEESGIFHSACNTWFDFGRWRYAGELVDEFTFEINDDGEVETVSIPGLRQKLTKA